MSKPALNLFPALVPIGAVQPDGTVLMTLEFARAMSALFVRVGGPVSMSIDDLAQLLLPAGPQPDTVARRAAADAALNVSPEWPAALAALARQVAALQAQVEQASAARADLAKIRRALADVEQVATYRDPFRVPWERPGRIGFFTPNTGAFTALTATTVNKLTVTPPASSATLTLADGKTFTVTNSIALAGVDGKTLTVNNTLGFSGSDGAFLSIGTGGTLGSAAYQNTNAFAARSSTALAPVATDPASTQTLANSLRAVLLSVGIGT